MRVALWKALLRTVMKRALKVYICIFYNKASVARVLTFVSNPNGCSSSIGFRKCVWENSLMIDCIPGIHVEGSRHGPSTRGKNRCGLLPPRKGDALIRWGYWLAK